MSQEVKTPNWRLSSCITASTGHHFLIDNRGEGTLTYFDSVRVFGGVVDRVKLYRSDESRDSGRSRAGAVRPSDLPSTVLAGLLHIEEHGRLPDTGDETWEEALAAVSDI